MVGIKPYFLANSDIEDEKIVDIGYSARKGIYAGIMAVEQAETLYSFVRSITQLAAITAGQDCFPSFKNAFNFLFKGNPTASVEEFIEQLQSSNVEISEGPIRVREDGS
jgi:hypothetical protein